MATSIDFPNPVKDATVVLRHEDGLISTASGAVRTVYYDATLPNGPITMRLELEYVETVVNGEGDTALTARDVYQWIGRQIGGAESPADTVSALTVDLMAAIEAGYRAVRRK